MTMLDSVASKCQPNPNRNGRWWQVRFRNAEGEKTVEVFELADQAESRQAVLSEDGVRSSIHRCRFDLLVVDAQSESLILINRRMLRSQAVRFASDWSKSNNSAGVMLWPSGKRPPLKLKFVDASADHADSGVAS